MPASRPPPVKAKSAAVGTAEAGTAEAGTAVADEGLTEWDAAPAGRGLGTAPVLVVVAAATRGLGTVGVEVPEPALEQREPFARVPQAPARPVEIERKEHFVHRRLPSPARTLRKTPAPPTRPLRAVGRAPNSCVRYRRAPARLQSRVCWRPQGIKLRRSSGSLPAGGAGGGAGGSAGGAMVAGGVAAMAVETPGGAGVCWMRLPSSKAPRSKRRARCCPSEPGRCLSMLPAYENQWCAPRRSPSTSRVSPR